MFNLHQYLREQGVSSGDPNQHSTSLPGPPHPTELHPHSFVNGGFYPSAEPLPYSVQMPPSPPQHFTIAAYQPSPSATMFGPVSEPRRYFDVIYINLDSRTDRRAAVEAKLATAGLHGFARLSAARGGEAPDSYVAHEWDSTLNARFDLNCQPTRHLRFSEGERGCAMSHALLWERVGARGDGGCPLLVLEDDVVLSDDVAPLTESLVLHIAQRLAPHERNVLLYLGAHVAKWRDGDRTLTEDSLHLREAEWLWQTHAYLIWPLAARELLAGLPMDMPVDNYISKNVLERRVRAFVCQPELAQQEAPYANGDVVHSSLSKLSAASATGAAAAPGGRGTHRSPSAAKRRS